MSGDAKLLLAISVRERSEDAPVDPPGTHLSPEVDLIC